MPAGRFRFSVSLLPPDFPWWPICKRNFPFLVNFRMFVSFPPFPVIQTFSVIDKNPVLEVGPFVAGSRAAPSLNDIPGLIEFEDRWRCDAAIGFVGRRVFIMIVQAARARRYPQVVV